MRTLVVGEFPTRIYIFDRDRGHPDHNFHNFYFITEHPELTVDEFNQLIRAWVVYQKEECQEEIKCMAIVLPISLEPGLAAYPTRVLSINQFIEHLRYVPPDGEVLKSVTNAIASLGEELVPKLFTLLDEDNPRGHG